METQEYDDSEEVRTLFVSGLPLDVKPREVYLLFRSCEGYQGSLLKLISRKQEKHPKPIAFVSFKTRKQAEEALHILQDVKFDPNYLQGIRLEFAHANSRSRETTDDQSWQLQNVIQATSLELYAQTSNSPIMSNVILVQPSQLPYHTAANVPVQVANGSYFYLLPNTNLMCATHQLLNVVAVSSDPNVAGRMSGNYMQMI